MFKLGTRVNKQQYGPVKKTTILTGRVEMSTRWHNTTQLHSKTRGGSGSGLERISADFGYVGCGFGSDFRPRVRGFGYPQHCGLGRILHFTRGYMLELRKIDSNKPA
jgi:hypothetical protein